MMRRKARPQREVRAPQMMNMSRQGASARVEFSPIPYMSRAPITCAIALQVIQQPIRNGCSSFLYQRLVMVMNAGDTAPSAAPSRNRTARNCPYVFGAARHIHITPQTIMVLPTNLTRGSLLIR